MHTQTHRQAGRQAGRDTLLRHALHMGYGLPTMLTIGYVSLRLYMSHAFPLLLANNVRMNGKKLDGLM